MKKTFFTAAFLVLFVMAFASPAFGATGDAYNFYCVRNKEHKQPRLDTNMSFIEKYNGYYVDKKHGDDTEEKVIYLTFDAGYENGNIEKILDVMKEKGVTGAFFVLGNLIEKEPELIKRMINEGHTIANHTFSHKDMTRVDNIEDFKNELDRLDTLYFETTGQNLSKYYRPPEGRFDERSLSFASELGYKTIFWSFAYDDWDNSRQPDIAAAKKKIFDNVHNGEVMLLHPTSSTNATILSDVIDKLLSEGYRFGTLDELTAV